MKRPVFYILHPILAYGFSVYH